MVIIKVSGVPSIEFLVASANVAVGDTYDFAGSFIMPNSAVTIHIYSYWLGSDGYWHPDDEMTKVVDLALVPQISEFKIADYARG